MMRRKNKNRTVKYVILAAAVTAICWDLAVSKLNVEQGTFRYESEFEALSASTTKVSIVTSDFAELSDLVLRTIDPTYKQIEEMVGKAIELQGGFEYIIDTGNKVMIKVNLVGGNNPSGDGNNTDVRVVKALIRHIAEYTGGDVEISVAEGTARTNDDISDPNSVWGNSGYIDLLSDPHLSGINLSLLNLNQSIEDLIEIDLGSESTSAAQGSKYHVHKAEVEADVYIAVPVLKIHNTGITNALKLQIGTAPGCYYGYNKTGGTALCPEGIIHEVNQRVWTTEAIVDLCNVADIDFVVVDAVMCLETVKTNKGYNQVRYNTVMAGADPVAIDHVGAKLMGLNPDDIAHITLAEKVGLGTNDPDHIDVVGVPIDQAMKKVKKSQSEDGKFGQSNRTWILSQAFESTDISGAFFINEANIQPIPGDNGWSEPVYFFDDRIDLLSFYSGRTNMVSYACTYFDAVQDQEAELWLGTHEAIQVYLNGEQVYSFNSTRYFGNRVEGLKFYIDDTGTGSELSNLPVYDISKESSIKSYPNPAREYTNISFELSKSRNTTVKIYDLNGRMVKSMCNEKLSAGMHEFTWNLDNDNGNRVGKGVYFCHIVSGKKNYSIKLIVE
jgi:uncharacterized protein (DUF362 family)